MQSGFRSVTGVMPVLPGVQAARPGVPSKLLVELGRLRVGKSLRHCSFAMRATPPKLPIQALPSGALPSRTRSSKISRP